MPDFKKNVKDAPRRKRLKSLTFFLKSCVVINKREKISVGGSPVGFIVWRSVAPLTFGGSAVGGAGRRPARA